MGELPRRRQAGAFAVALVGVGGAWAWCGCGGTSGRELLAALTATATDAGQDATQDATHDGATDSTVVMPIPDAGLDATTMHPDADEGLFGVIIPYADRALPQAQAPVVDGGNGGEGGGVVWPNCPPDVLDNSSGYAIAAQYDDAGNVVPAPDGSACATFPWMGRLDWTNCVRANTDVTPAGLLGNGAILPPCSLFRDAGKAMQGTGAGHPLFALCRNLVDCIARAQCWADPAQGVQTCLCGPGNSDECAKMSGLSKDAGPCKDEELAAMQIEPQSPGAMATAIANRLTVNPNSLFSVAGDVNSLWEIGVSSHCFSLGDAGTD